MGTGRESANRGPRRRFRGSANAIGNAIGASTSGECALRIESLEVQNFKVLRHLKLDNIPDLVVIAGPNGSGKTSLFDAIRLFKESIATYSLQYRGRGGVFINTLLQQIGPVVRAGESTATVTASIEVSEAEREAISLPDDHSGVLTGTVRVTAGQSETAQLVSSSGGGADAPYLQQLLGGYRTGGDFGMMDHPRPAVGGPPPRHRRPRSVRSMVAHSRGVPAARVAMGGAPAGQVRRAKDDHLRDRVVRPKTRWIR